MKRLIFLIILFVVIGCSKNPEPIRYGKDTCYYCKMAIVDRVHAAEIVTNKGKIYKYDAIECMVGFLNDFDNSKVKLFLTNEYLVPEKLIDATKATFLISKKIKSPMGANLSAFKEVSSAKKTQEENGGDLYTWSQLITHLK